MKTRKYYQMIAEEAFKDASFTPNEAWKMSLMNLFHAANVMDAFVARSTGPKVEIGDDNAGDEWKNDPPPASPAS